MMKALVLGLALASCQAQPALPQPAPWIFVFHEPHNAWFYSGFKATPVGNSLGGIPIAAINGFWAVANPLCQVQQVERSSFVGVDRAAQLEIEADLQSVPHDPFRLEFTHPDGRKLVALVGLAEECETGALRTVILVQDSSSGWIEHLDIHINYFVFLFPHKEGASIAKSHCLTCNDKDRRRLVYDAEERDFSYQRSFKRADRPLPAQLSVGQVIDPYPGDTVDGWSMWSGSSMSRRIENQHFIVETGECCTSLFFKGSSYLIVRTVPVSKLPADGDFDPKGRIVETLKIDPLPDEELMECSLLWIQPAASLVNQKTNQVRSFVATPDGIRQIKWTNEGNACYVEDRN